MLKSRVCLLIFCLLASGCGNVDDETEDVMMPAGNANESVVGDELTHPDMALEEERGRKLIEHLKKYLELKDKDPEAAYIELKKSAELTWWRHELVEQWTELVFDIDRIGKASIRQMIRMFELELQMAKDKSPYKEQVTYLEGQLKFWKEEEKLAEATGRDPNEQDVKWAIRVEE